VPYDAFPDRGHEGGERFKLAIDPQDSRENRFEAHREASRSSGGRRDVGNYWKMSTDRSIPFARLRR